MSQTPNQAQLLAGGASDVSPSALARLAHVKLRMTVEVGRTQLTLDELLRLSEGAVVELDRMAGDPMDILVNGTPIAKGEVVVVGERFGIRFGEIIDPEGGLKNL